jgi:hypothetical protein
MVRILVATVLMLSLEVRAESTEIYRFGSAAERLSAQELQVIVSLQPNVLALHCWISQIAPTTKYVDLFIWPSVTEGRLRRGSFVQLLCEPASTTTPCEVWRASEEAGPYAQVSEAHRPFSSTTRVLSEIERPFRVSGNFSDNEIIEIVDFLRSSPSVGSSRSGELESSSSMPVDGRLPLQYLARENDFEVSVWLSRDGYVFQGVTLLRAKNGWQVSKVWAG